jgi:hypothetical protein
METPFQLRSPLPFQFQRSRLFIKYRFERK